MEELRPRSECCPLRLSGAGVKGMEREEFCRRVIWQMKRATLREQDWVKAELMGHLEDHIDALREDGYSQEKAEAEAIAAMGEPEEVGKALNRQYPVAWRITSLLLLAAVVYLLWKLLWSGYLFGFDFYERWKIHNDRVPYLEELFLSGAEWESYPLREQVDLRAEIGNNDEIQVYSVFLDPEQGLAGVTVRTYDRDLMGYVGMRSWDFIHLENQAGNRVGCTDSLGDATVEYSLYTALPVKPGDDHVTVSYERNGERVSVEVPLPREVSE